MHPDDQEDRAPTVGVEGLGWEPEPMPIAPDGGMTPGAYQPAGGEGPPPWDEANCKCLQGPCRYLFAAEQHFPHGNAPGTLEREPRHHITACTAASGVWLELSRDEPILKCSHWDPADPAAQAALEARRKAYAERADRAVGLAAEEDDEEEIARDVQRAMQAPPPPPPFPSVLKVILSRWVDGWQADIGYEVSVDQCESPQQAVGLAVARAKELHERATQHAAATQGG